MCLSLKFRREHTNDMVMDTRNSLSADDNAPCDIEQQEKVYFANIGVERYAVARKPDVVSVLSSSLYC